MSTPTVKAEKHTTDTGDDTATPATGSATRGSANDEKGSDRPTAGGDSFLARASGVKLGLKQVVVGLVVLGMAVAIGILGFVVADKSDTISAMQSETAAATTAEQRALDYATGAADMNYKDLGAWNSRLTANTSPELTAKLTEASTSMEQVIVPLQWTSTAQPIAASVKSHEGSVYVVSAFVSVMTKNAQAPDGVQSTASYTVTMDSSKDWLITDVGGIDGAVAPK
ncbi:hypothetical protein K8O93_07025 [Gordonia bronchialis]|uniref:Mce-associated membrane protein n=1 Tax=Gordonia westfalica TaxID=158898 RepID=A0A1H2KKY1_9ACTN|nr:MULTISPECIES: hypothetical protein [Gordonia]UAK39418.1 hypothetical protein K8O93_07025 [Gordonia bronchialis]SDU69283.1 Mce-associated membrane protein [Gordonia westfalica]